MDVFPAWLVNIWNAWDLRVLVLCSQTLQIILILFGSKRKYIKGNWIEFMVWSAYLLADSMATLALGKLSDIASSDQNLNNYVLLALWAPLLLLHLGGPDTITAYAVEDTKLWSRHLLGLVVQVLVAIYVLMLCWVGSWISVLIVLVFISGIIKYGERTWALWSVNNKDPKDIFDTSQDHRQSLALFNDVPGVKFLVLGYFSSKFMTPYLENYVHSDNIYFVATYLSSIFETNDSVFMTAELGLGFIYDVLYTKATVIYTMVGLILRPINFTCIVAVLVGFSVISKDGYSELDISITYLLLVGAVVLEVYAFSQLVSSDWTLVSMMKHLKKPFICSTIHSLAPWVLKNQRRWSQSIGQFNLLSFCLYRERQNLVHRSLKICGMDKEFNRYWFQSHIHEAKCLKEIIFDGIKRRVVDIDRSKAGFFLRGETTIKRHGNPLHFFWILNKDDDEWILIWHIATDICYYDHKSRSTDTPRELEASRILSNYMMHLLVRFPHLMRRSRARIDFEEDVCKPEISPIVKGLQVKGEAEICTEMRRAYEQEDDENVENRQISRDALKLAGLLWSDEYRANTWKIICGVWVDMLCCVAALSKMEYHVEQLRRGGELLSQAWFILSISGMTDSTRGIDDELRAICKQALGFDANAASSPPSAREAGPYVDV